MSNSDDPHASVRWALDLFEPDPTYQENFISKHYQWIVWPGVFLSGVAYTNYFQGRPYIAGLPRYGIALAASLVIAKVFKDAKFHRESERDLVLRHYIKLHPEDFPEPERKKFGDVLNMWTPCR